MFAELHPTGAAAGEHGQLLTALQAFHQFMGFFHDGQVSGDVHVEYGVSPQTADGCHHLAFNIGADGHVETFTQGGTDGGGGEEYDLLLGVGDRVPDIVDLALFTQGADGAGNNTLTAADAGRICQALFKGAADMDVITTLNCADDRYRLHVFAGGDTAHALDALGVVTHDIRGSVIHREDGVIALETVFVYFVVEGQFLQFAVVAADAGQTLFAVAGEDQFDGSLTGSTDHGSIGEYFHAFFDGVDTAGDQTSTSLDFDNADTAGTDAVDIS